MQTNKFCLKIRKKKMLITCVVTILAVAMIDFVNRKGPSWANHLYRTSFKSAETNDTSKFERLLRDGCYNLIETEGKYGSKPLSNSKTIWDFITCNRSFSQFGYGEYGLLMHYSFLYAKRKNDIQLKNLIKLKFDIGFKNNGINIERLDQTAYGNVAIDLYYETNDIFYKQFADKLYDRLDSIIGKDGIVLYRQGTTTQEVDAIGLACPFLLYYSKYFRNDKAREIASRMIEEFIKWGTDDITGIPCQSYNIKNHVKMNHSNWGRGISWYLLGIMDYEPKDTIYSTRIELLQHTLISDEDHLYNHYYSQGEIPDMSATIPVLYYLKEKDVLKLDKTELTKLLSPYCDEEGIVRFCSPSISFPHEKVSVTQKSLQSNGILLYLLTL